MRLLQTTPECIAPNVNFSHAEIFATLERYREMPVCASILYKSPALDRIIPRMVHGHRRLPSHSCIDTYAWRVLSYMLLLLLLHHHLLHLLLSHPSLVTTFPLRRIPHHTGHRDIVVFRQKLNKTNFASERPDEQHHGRSSIPVKIEIGLLCSVWYSDIEKSGRPKALHGLVGSKR